MILRLTAKLHETTIVQEGRTKHDLVAICLEHDTVAQGSDQDEVIASLSACIAANVQWAEREGRDVADALGDPAPSDEVERFTGPIVSFTVDTNEWHRGGS